MASPFAFVPRKVAKSAKAQVSVTNVSPSFVEGSSNSLAGGLAVQKPSGQSPLTTTVKDNGKGKAKAVDASAKSLASEDYAILVCLALSDHALWSDPDLRRTIEQHTENCMYTSDLTCSSLKRN